jgi:ABC-type sugar transport system ATPase subunit
VLESVAATPRLELAGLTRSFGAVRALNDVSLCIAPGEIRGLCGHNGAGKSTLLNVLAGLLPPDAGEIRLDGRPLVFRSPRDAQEDGIAWVDQELSMISTLSIAENVALGQSGGGLLRHRRRERASTRELQAKVGLEDHDPDELVGDLSLGKRQLVEIARALGRGARLLILDEPTATLTDLEIDLVFDAIRRVAREGCSVIFVSHRLGEVLALCDVVTVLRDGRIVEERPVGELSPDRLVEAMLGEQLEPAPRAGGQSAEEMMLRVSGLRVDSRVHDFSLEFAAGRVYGIVGQIGAGASEVLRAIAGLIPSAVGSVELAGRPFSLRHPVQARRQGVGFVTNDRKQDGLFLGRSVSENLLATQLNEISRAGVISPRRERGRGLRLAEAAGVDAGRLETAVGRLSGGNQQKALVGRYLLGSKVKVLLVDEPTRGVDVGGRAAIHRVLLGAAAEGITVIFASSDLEEMLELAMIVVTMRAGRVVGVYRDGVSRPVMLTDLTHRRAGATTDVADPGHDEAEPVR